MDCMKPPPSSQSTQTKSSRTPFSKCLDPQTPSRFPTDLAPPTTTNKQLRTLSEELNISLPETRTSLTTRKQHTSLEVKHKQALLAKLFASVSTIKACYAELQIAQFPYNNDAIQAADEALVAELLVISELKRKYLSKDLDLPPPHVTHLLAEIQEQQSNIKTYEITMKQLEGKVRHKERKIEDLRVKFEKIRLEKKMSTSGVMCMISSNVSMSNLNQTHFIRVLNHTLRSVRHFVEHLVSNMKTKNWDIELAVKAIEPGTTFAGPQDWVFGFESFVFGLMFDGFNQEKKINHSSKQYFFESFMKHQNMTVPEMLSRNYPFAQFCRDKYLKVVHPKMECSFFGNLDQRKVITSGAFPSTEFFSLFAEMARRVWLLHCLAFSFDPPAVAFRVKRGCRFSEVYMECVSSDVIAGDLAVAITVVPGFKIGKTVIQSRVYLSPPVVHNRRSR